MMTRLLINCILIWTQMAVIRSVHKPFPSIMTVLRWKKSTIGSRKARLRQDHINLSSNPLRTTNS